MKEKVKSGILVFVGITLVAIAISMSLSTNAIDWLMKSLNISNLCVKRE